MIAEDPRDAALFSALPVIRVPRFGRMSPIEPGAARLLLASDGLYLEARSNVLHAVVLAAPMAGLPYGRVQPQMESPHLDRLAHLLAEVPALARAALPREWAGVVALIDGALQLVVPPVVEAGTAHIRYDATRFNPLNVLMDVHSHGRHGAFFSSTDDQDDAAMASPVFLAGVVGALGPQSDGQEWVTRGVILGREFDLETCAGVRHLVHEIARGAASEPGRERRQDR